MKIAAVITEYRQLSHADVILGKYLEGYNHDDQPPYPRSKIVSMFTEQVPSNDLSREKARKYGIPIFRTVADALTLGTEKLAVDGVILIGEHGTYPLNDQGQKLYPRFEMFLKVTDVFRETRRSVPVYTDKHLSWNWRQARRMVEIARELRFPMLAGSSIPVAYRVPAHDVPYGAGIPRGVVISFGGLEGYGFHGLEGLQALMERRAGGETGVAAVQCLEGEACWRHLDGDARIRKLFDSALSRSETRKPGGLRALVKNPAVFVLEYRDGARGSVFQMPGLVEDWTGAVEIEGQAEPFSVLFRLQRFGQRHHFGCLIQNIEIMFETGKAPYPVERTMLTAGALDFALLARSRGQSRVETPGLGVRYRPAEGPCYCTKGWSADGKRLDL
ncbi:MAG: hypothetical protein FJW39_17460 [Acidobacteria bacterium]|nr:hypothetical protein [Acidobacteriota bacterium]